MYLLLELRKKLFGGGAEDIMNFVNLVQLIVAREQREKSKDLEVDAADTPVVHLVVVVAVCQ